MIAYAPTVLMWGPSYVKESWLKVYRKTKAYAKKMHYFAGVTVMTFLLSDLIYVSDPSDDPRARNIWVTMLLYIEFETLIWWAIPHFKLD